MTFSWTTARSSETDTNHRAEAHPLLQQTPLTVNPFIELPKAPTLPHNYMTLPPTLPHSLLNAAPAPSHPELPAYVTAPGGSGFAAHPRAIIAQNQALLDQVAAQRRDGAQAVEAWENGIRARELAEKRRKAPGWLDSEARLLEPEKKSDSSAAGTATDPAKTASLLDDSIESAPGNGGMSSKDVEDLGAAMDRAFGRNGAS